MHSFLKSAFVCCVSIFITWSSLVLADKDDDTLVIAFSREITNLDYHYGTKTEYLILGDMLELGTKSKKYHEELSKVINNSDIDKVFIKGKKTIFTYKHLNKDKRGNILQDNEDIDFMLSRVVMNNDYVMIKGSNATGLNTFSQKIIRGN